MQFEQVSHFAQTWGLVLLAICFAVAVGYALWPGNRDKFKRAARNPLDDEDNNAGQ